MPEYLAALFNQPVWRGLGGKKKEKRKDRIEGGIENQMPDIGAGGGGGRNKQTKKPSGSLPPTIKWMFTVPGRTPSSDVCAPPAPDGSTAQCLGLGAVGNAREWLFVDFRLCESLVLLRSEVLLNLLTQAEHSTGRKEAAILSGPIVWPPGLGNQTAQWPGSGSRSCLFWWAWGRRRAGEGCLLMARTWFSPAHL